MVCRRKCFGSFTTTTLCIGSMELCRREMRYPHEVVRNIEITRGRIIWDCTEKQEKTDVTTDLGTVVPGSLPVWSASRKLDDCERVVGMCLSRLIKALYRVKGQVILPTTQF